MPYTQLPGNSCVAQLAVEQLKNLEIRFLELRLTRTQASPSALASKRYSMKIL
jgi:hypothetical protein